MENGTAWGTWLAYAVIVVFLILLAAVVIRTVAMFATLTFMPLARVSRWFFRLFVKDDTA
jgi:hypothetical protein